MKEVERVRCLACGAENPPDFSFCGHCGASLPRPCPRCGFGNPRGFSFCGRCGADLLSSFLALPQAPLEGERRFVVVLFADLAGFTRLSEQLDPEEATVLVNRCLDEMTRAVVQHGGRVDKYTGDGLMAVFGAPVAHEDDPEQALRAALAMRERVAGLRLGSEVPSLALHVGLACGRVVAAGVGGRERKEYTVIGRSVNLAARLEEASTPGQILVGEDLARLTEHAFSLRLLILPSLPGWAGEVRAFELLGEHQDGVQSRQVGELRSPLVGRDVEVALLWRSLEDLAAGKGAILSIIGEVGIGKSRLLAEVRAQTQGRGFRLAWLEGHPLERGEAVRYGCFRTLLREAIGAIGEVNLPRIAERLRLFLDDLMPQRVEEVYPYLGRLLGVPLSPEATERLERLDGESLKWQTFQAVRECISALASRDPLVLVFEDLHWVDRASAELLERLLPLVAQIALIIIGVYRPEPERPSWQLRELTGREHGDVYNELWLHPLSSTAARDMVIHLLGTDRLHEEAMDLILERTEGNPLFIEEIVRSMVTQGILVQQADGRWRMMRTRKEVTIPDTIQGLFQARVDRLDEEVKGVLQVAACIGRHFPYRLLAAVVDDLGMPRSLLDRCLGTLEKAGLIQQEDGLSEKGYVFRHVLVHDTVHRALLKSARSRFHGAVARRYEENILHDAEPSYALLARHYEQTDDYEKQRLYFALAGRQAAQGYANREAYAFFSKALVLTTDPAERWELLQAREAVCDLLGDRAQQRADLEELLELASVSGDRRRRAMICNRLAAWHESQGDYAAACSTAEEGLVAAREVGDFRREAESLLIVATAAWRRGQFSAALEAAQAALEVSRMADDAVCEANSLTTMGIVHRSRGDLLPARACYQQALDIRRALGDRRGEAISLIHLANVLYDEGDYTAACDWHKQALDLFRMVGDRRGEAWSLSGLGRFYLICGDYEAARVYYEEALTIRRDIGDRRGEAVALSDLGHLLLAMGELETARAHLEQAVTLARALGARRDEVYGLAYLGRALENMGNLGGAQAAYQTALSRCRERGQQASCVENTASLGRVALEHGDLEAARTYVAEVLAYTREHGLAGVESPFLVYQTCIRILDACGEKEAARQMLETAYGELLERMERIADPQLQRSFLERVPEHREIVAAWREAGGEADF